MEIISIILNFDFHFFGIEFKLLYLVVLGILIKIFLRIFAKGD